MSRHVATGADDYISLRAARDVFLAHSRPVSERTLQRSCVNGHIAGKKIVTAEGEKWFALRSSVLNRIAELAKFDELRERHDATRRDMTRRVAEDKQRETGDDTQRHETTANVSQPVVSAQPSHTTPSDASRPDATSPGTSAELKRIEELYAQLLAAYKEQAEDLRKDKTTLQSDKEALLAQLLAKDSQIERFFTSERETKTLFGTLQTLIASIMPGRQGGDRYVQASDALARGLEHRREDGER
jgi:hypothetical protein